MYEGGPQLGILVVVDETQVARALRKALERERYAVDAPAEFPGKKGFRWLALALFAAIFCTFPGWAGAQSPELSMREFSSGQIKKGVRSIGFGGDGATWGNYGLVWLDANTVLTDYGDTHYTNGNDFHFYAVGVTTPPLWHRLAIYVIAMSQGTNNVRLNVKSPGLGPGAVPVIGTGSDTAVFSKIALPVGKGVSVGVLLSHETSHFDATAQQGPQLHVRYQTDWRPSGGFGVAWQPSKRLLLGFRGLFNNDLERRTDPVSVAEGLARTQEYRLGGSLSPWDGALIDVGATRLERRNALAATHTIVYHPNLGFEQALLKRRLTLRFGLDETSPTVGISVRYGRFKLDTAYVDNMARSRLGNLFGTHSNSFLFTVTFDYARKKKDGPAKPVRTREPHQVASDPLPLAD
jgi:hypothetical protein